MPRILGGHTELGATINEANKKTDHLERGKISTRRAVIKKSYNGKYIFFMTLLDRNSNAIKTTGPIPIIGTTEELAMRYGSPEDMEGRWEVIISYRGSSANNGTATISRRVGEVLGGKTEETQQANQLSVKGTAFAPPGSGV